MGGGRSGASRGVKSVNVDMTFDPQWGMEMTDEARLELGFIDIPGAVDDA